VTLDPEAGSVQVTLSDVTVTDLADVRRDVECAANAIGLDTSRARQFTLAVSEVAANALEHGEPPCTVTIRTRERELVVQVADRGRGFTPTLSPIPQPAVEQDRGRGLWLAQQWADGLTIDNQRTGFTVTLTVGIVNTGRAG
jgi:anti-sigma regulatory factor (Ser/Thr protein kinase)